MQTAARQQAKAVTCGGNASYLRRESKFAAAIKQVRCGTPQSASFYRYAVTQVVPAYGYQREDVLVPCANSHIIAYIYPRDRKKERYGRRLVTPGDVAALLPYL